MNHQLPKVHSSLFSLLLSCFWFCFAPSSTSSTWFSSLSLPACLPPSPVPAAAQAITIVETGEKHRANSPGRRQFVRNQKNVRNVYTDPRRSSPARSRQRGATRNTASPPPAPCAERCSRTSQLSKVSDRQPRKSHHHKALHKLCFVIFFTPVSLSRCPVRGWGWGREAAETTQTLYFSVWTRRRLTAVFFFLFWGLVFFVPLTAWPRSSTRPVTLPCLITWGRSGQRLGPGCCCCMQLI